MGVVTSVVTKGTRMTTIVAGVGTNLITAIVINTEVVETTTTTIIESEMASMKTNEER